jgi:hypothetical protein
MPKVAMGDEYVYVCQMPGCTRFMVPWLPEAYTPEGQDRWLIAPYRHDLNILVVRCPQHISQRALRWTIGMHHTVMEWAQRVKEEDRETNERWSPATPYPLDPRLMWTDDGRLSVSLKGRSNMAARRARKLASGL